MTAFRFSLIILFFYIRLILASSAYLLPNELKIPSGNINFSTAASQSYSYGFLMSAPDSHFLYLFPSLGVSSYTNLTLAGDAGIIYSSGTINGSGAGLILAPWNSGTKGIRIKSSGKVGIGTASPGSSLEINGVTHVSGNVRVSGNVSIDGSIQASGTIVDLTGSVRTPAGTIIVYAGSSAPGGWLLCDGSTVSRTTYSTLYGVIGTTYGSGNGSTTFTLPNLTGKFPIGLDSSDSAMNSVGESSGQKTVAGNNLPSHYHSISNHTHTYSDTYWVENRNGTVDSPELGSNHRGSSDSDGNNESYEVTRTTDAGGSGDTGSATSDVTNSSMNIMNPYIVMRYIIKY